MLSNSMQNRLSDIEAQPTHRPGSLLVVSDIYRTSIFFCFRKIRSKKTHKMPKTSTNSKKNGKNMFARFAHFYIFGDTWIPWDIVYYIFLQSNILWLKSLKCARFFYVVCNIEFQGRHWSDWPCYTWSFYN